MAELGPGLYELLITEGLRAQLDELAERLTVDERPLNSADASDLIAWHVSRPVERALLDVSDDDRVQVGVRVARALLDRLGELVATDGTALPVDPAAILQAVRRRNPDGTPAQMGGPLIPLLDTTLLTNAPGEPTLWSQLRSEIESADAIDVVMAFIRRSGIAPLLDSLQRHCEAGGPLRILTTTYTDSTERRAVDQLVDRGADVRISYDLGTTRLHAKAWVFHRRSGFSTAYVGSSNLTHSAQVTGLEWNVRASEARNPDVIAKFAAVFDSYWVGRDFVPYDPRRVRRRTGACRPHRSRPPGDAEPDRAAAVPVSRTPARADRTVTTARSSPQSARRGDGHRQDRHGDTRLRGAAWTSRPIPIVVHRPPRGDPRPEPCHVSLRTPRCLIR